MDLSLDRLGYQMFKTFARAEYALKAAGFLQRGGDAKADWTGFAASVSDIFDNPPDAAFEEAVDYILRRPPKKQIVRDGNLDWERVPPNTNLQSDLVLQYVRRVRNNLFHGGKFNDRWFEPERDKDLLRHCLTVLNTCVNACDDVREAYHNWR